MSYIRAHDSGSLCRISLSSIPDLRKYKNSFEAHLMVKNPEKWIKAVSEKGFRKMIFHIEAVRSSRKAEEIISRIKEYEMIPYIAINSDTPLNRIIPLIKSNKIENLLVMGGHAGKEHQKLNAKTPQRIKKLKRLNSKLFIQIDMGVNNETASLLKEADALNSGSFVAGSKNPKKALALLKKTFMDNSGD